MKRIAFIAALVVAVLAAVWFFSRPKPVAVALVTAERGPVAATISNTRAGTVDACRRAGLDAVAVLDGQACDLAAERGRQAGATTGVHGSGPRVADGGGNGTPLRGDERHRNGLWPREKPHRGQHSDDERRNDGDALHSHYEEWGIGGQSNGFLTY